MVDRRTITAIGLLLSANLAGCGESPPPPLKAIGNDQFVIVIDKAESVDAIEARARAQCAGKQFCKVFGWTDQSLAASAMPMTDREAATLAFSYSLNRASGLDAASWDCSQRPQGDPARCLAK